MHTQMSAYCTLRSQRINMYMYWNVLSWSAVQNLHGYPHVSHSASPILGVLSVPPLRSRRSCCSRLHCRLFHLHRPCSYFCSSCHVGHHLLSQCILSLLWSKIFLPHWILAWSVSETEPCSAAKVPALYLAYDVPRLYPCGTRPCKEMHVLDL